jgi:hypothetical protein
MPTPIEEMLYDWTRGEVHPWRRWALAQREALKAQGQKYLPPMSAFFVAWRKREEAQA